MDLKGIFSQKEREEERERKKENDFFLSKSGVGYDNKPNIKSLRVASRVFLSIRRSYTLGVNVLFIIYKFHTR